MFVASLCVTSVESRIAADLAKYLIPPASHTRHLSQTDGQNELECAVRKVATSAAESLTPPRTTLIFMR
ncbi:MAG: hypothetical protein NTW75_10300 [Planctomycetales bacterium]|nr:hypothetical protein [Planctomycetales bacterium]